MKTVALRKIVQSLALVAVGAFSTDAFADATWKFGDDLPTATVLCSASEASAGCAPQAGASVGSPSVKVSAFSTTGAGSAFAAAALKSYDGGLGVGAAGESTGSPQHAMDNSGTTDLILFDFGSAKVELDSVTIGWKSNSTGGDRRADADISVFRYTGAPTATTPAVASLAATAAGLLSGGWTLVGNYADLSTSSAKSVNTTNTTSSWWLISAYNTGYGVASGADQGAAASTSNSYSGLQGGNDYFKVLSIAGNYTVPPTISKTPEPGSLALMGAAMVGFMATRRRKQQVA